MPLYPYFTLFRATKVLLLRNTLENYEYFAHIVLQMCRDRGFSGFILRLSQKFAKKPRNFLKFSVKSIICLILKTLIRKDIVLKYTYSACYRI